MKLRRKARHLVLGDDNKISVKMSAGVTYTIKNMEHFRAACARYEEWARASGYLSEPLLRQHRAYCELIAEFSKLYVWQHIMLYDNEVRARMHFLVATTWEAPHADLFMKHLMPNSLAMQVLSRGGGGGANNKTKAKGGGGGGGANGGGGGKGGGKNKGKGKGKDKGGGGGGGRDTDKSNAGKTCHDYQRGVCTHDPCRYGHRCSGCGGAHPKSSCPSADKPAVGG